MKNNKECKVVCEGKNVASFDCDEGACSVKLTEEGKKMFKGCNCC